MYKLTDEGKKYVENYIYELQLKRKAILDAGIDTVNKVGFPTVDSVVEDLNDIGVNENGECYITFSITDTIPERYPLILKYGIDFRVDIKESWKTLRTKNLKLRYGKRYDEWKHYSDDRKVFANTYEMLMEAIESLPDEPKPFVCVAMNEAINKECRMLDEIIDEFSEGEKVGIIFLTK